jgi:hypothetical protein
MIPFLGIPVKGWAQEENLRSYKVKPGILSGLVTDAQGQVLAGKMVSVVDAKGRVISAGVTDKRGFYRLTRLPEGKYTFKIDGRPMTEIEVTNAAKIMALKFVLPPPHAALGSWNWTLITTGAVAVAVAVPVIIHNSKNSSRTTVSP